MVIFCGLNSRQLVTGPESPGSACAIVTEVTARAVGEPGRTSSPAIAGGTATGCGMAAVPLEGCPPFVVFFWLWSECDAVAQPRPSARRVRITLVRIFMRTFGFRSHDSCADPVGVIAGNRGARNIKNVT